MRIAFITFEYPPFIIGGAGIYAANITHEFGKLGHQVIVFTPEINGSEEKCNSNVEIRRIKINKRFPFKALQFWLRLPNVIREAENDNKFDVIHFNGISYGFLKTRISRAPQVVTIHHLVRDAIQSNNLSLISRIRDISGENSLFIPFIEKRCIKCADRIIAVSNFTKNQIIKTYKVPFDKIEVVYNGTDFNTYAFTKEELKEAKKQLNLDEKPVILFVGRVDDPRKGLRLLLKALRKVLEQIDVALLVVGKGNQTEARKLAKSLGVSGNVLFTGFVDEVTLIRCYALCDVYVCPSRLEGFGLTVLEAMAVGKPVVVSNTGAIPEVVEDAGVVVEQENPDALAEGVIELLNDEHKRKRLERRALKRVHESFTWGGVVRQVEQVYESCVTKS